MDCARHSRQKVTQGQGEQPLVYMQSAGSQALKWMLLAGGRAQTETADTVSFACRSRQKQSLQMTSALPHSGYCCIAGDSCPKTALNQDLGWGDRHLCLEECEPADTGTPPRFFSSQMLVLCEGGVHTQTRSGPAALSERWLHQAAIGCRPRVATPAHTNAIM